MQSLLHAPPPGLCCGLSKVLDSIHDGCSEHQGSVQQSQMSNPWSHHPPELLRRLDSSAAATSPDRRAMCAPHCTMRRLRKPAEARSAGNAARTETIALPPKRTLSVSDPPWSGQKPSHGFVHRL